MNLLFMSIDNRRNHINWNIFYCGKKNFSWKYLLLEVDTEELLQTPLLLNVGGVLGPFVALAFFLKTLNDKQQKR